MVDALPMQDSLRMLRITKTLMVLEGGMKSEQMDMQMVVHSAERMGHCHLPRAHKEIALRRTITRIGHHCVILSGYALDSKFLNVKCSLRAMGEISE